MPTPNQYVDSLRRDGMALAEAARRDLEAAVPSCPGWTVADLVRHTGEVHRKKLATVQLGGTTRPESLDWQEPPADDAALLHWYTDGLTQLADFLVQADPEQPAWSWGGDNRVAFWQRRMAQETLIHRWDGEAAVGDPGPLDAEMAADGIDEYLRIFLDDPDTPPQGATGSIAVATTDVGRSWTLDTRQWPPTISDEAAGDADATITGDAESVLLALWRRRPLSTVDLSGDAAVVTSVHDAADL